jgi:hypothetical protein
MRKEKGGWLTVVEPCSEPTILRPVVFNSVSGDRPDAK